MDITRLVDGFTNKKKIEKPDSDTLNKMKLHYTGICDKYNYDDRIPMLRQRLIDYLAYAELGAINRGLLLIGGTGLGKTMFLAILSKVFDIPFFTADEIVSQIDKDYGYKNLFADEIVIRTEDDFSRYLIIDEIGDEPTYTEFGMKYEVMSRIINDRYRAFLQDGYKSYFSSNLSEKEFIERYGIRIWSRLNQMCTLMSVTGEDQRLK